MIHTIKETSKTIKKIKNETQTIYFTNEDIKENDKIILESDDEKISIKVKEIVDIKKSDFKCYPFLGYYTKYILEDEDIYLKVKTLYDFDLPEYTDETKCQFLFLTDKLQDFKDTGALPMPEMYREEEKYNYYLLNKLRDSLFIGCENWLDNIEYNNKYSKYVIFDL